MPVLQTQLRTSRIADDRYVVSVAGALDVDVARTLRIRLGDLVESGATTIVVDLLEVATIDSRGLSLLVDFGKVLRASRGELLVVADDPTVVKLLTISGAGRHFTIDSSLLSAVNRVVGGRA